MNFTKRQGALFFASLVLVAMVVALAWRVVGSRTTSVANTADSAPLPSLPIASRQVFTCQVQPDIAAASEKDGQFPFQSDLSGLTANEIGSFTVIGRESASAGRPRDAETAFLMACRLAEKFKGSGSVESADVKYQLGGHYAALAREGLSGAVEVRAEMLGRAQGLYTDSLNAYREMFGEAHEKSRVAAEGLATVRQLLAQARPSSESSAVVTAGRASEPASPSVPGRSAVSPAPGATPPRKTELAKLVPPPRNTPVPVARLKPSFDCRQARSIPEKMICSDAELAQLDRELGRIYARARNATANQAAFRRQQNQEWLRRESSCRDRDCLLRWFETRRDQLMREIEGRRPLPATASSR